MKISLITVVFNGEKYLEESILSVLAQDYPDLEYIVVDGASTDGSLDIIRKYSAQITHFISEKDRGMYDALNKGIALSTGEIIGILNADDMLASPDVLSAVAEMFRVWQSDALYGHLNYVDPAQPEKIIRRWRARPFKPRDMARGWMPAHPTFYAKRPLFNQYGNYSLNFGSAADYELMLRFLYKNRIKTVFLDKLMVNMRVGGMSNASLKQRYHAFLNDYKALRHNGVPFSIVALFLKKVSKLQQFVR